MEEAKTETNKIGSEKSSESDTDSESFIEKIEDKVKEIGEDIKEGFKETIEEVKEGIEKAGEGVKNIVKKVEDGGGISKLKIGSESKDSESVTDSEASKIAEEHKQEEIEKSHSRHHPVKEKVVNKLIDKMQHAKTIMVVDIKGLPSKQFQEIKKSIREYAEVHVAKKNIITRAIEKFGKKEILLLKEHILENCALAISDMEGYELAGILAQKKTPAAAKAGQESPEDIEVKAGPTDLVPGPAISELGAVGLQVAVEDGKLSIKKSKVIITKGQTINAGTASILQKLNIMPFTVGLEPIAIYDVETGAIYTDVKVDSEEAKASLASAAGKALGFAQKIVYYAKETIGYLLAKANAEMESISKLESSEASTNAESKDSDTEEKKEEGASSEDKSSEEDNNKTSSESKASESHAQLNNPEENA